MEKAPYIVGARASLPDGSIVAYPVGVIMATSSRRAWDLAVMRWRGLVISRLDEWEKIEPHIRLAALEADRQIDNEFNLPIRFIF